MICLAKVRLELEHYDIERGATSNLLDTAQANDNSTVSDTRRHFAGNLVVLADHDLAVRQRCATGLANA